MTIEKIRIDIKLGDCRTVYYSSQTLWWTHLDADLLDASLKGRQAMEKKMQGLLNNPGVPEPEKKKLKNLFDIAAMNKNIPLDPSGSPLFQCNAIQFLISAESTPKLYGQHGMNAFVKAHHQNCDGNYFTTWALYNQLIDNQI